MDKQMKHSVSDYDTWPEYWHDFVSNGSAKIGEYAIGDYQELLNRKKKAHKPSGFEVSGESLNKYLFPFQRFIVKRALAAGKYAIFADCGLGKTLMQLEWAHQVSIKMGAPVLILAPLAVSGQTIEQGNKFGIGVQRYDGSDAPVQITNYEQLHNIDCSKFAGVVLDESSILKNFEGKIKKLVLSLFANTPYKLCCTATPSPNDPTELGNHAEFLGVMTRLEMLAMYFIHDGGDTSKWRLKGHAQETFYQFVGTWAIMLTKPEDIGFPMDGYCLPALKVTEYQVKTPHRDNGKLFNDMSVSATDFNQELRATREQRLAKVANIVNSRPDDSFIIWVKHNKESEELRKMFPGSVEVKGNDKPEYKEKMLLGFGQGEFRILITKTKIASFGMNYQNCHNQIFASLDFSFEGLYQAIRRSYRFGQESEVNIHLITTDTMSNVKKSLDEKQKLFEEMQLKMSKAVNAHLYDNLLSQDEFDTTAVKNNKYHIMRGDCVQLIKGLANESIDFSVFSPPFADLYTYSSHVEDMGNCTDYNEFMEQFKFLVRELFRVVRSGRNVAVHCMDLPIQKGKEGYIGLRDFSGMIREAFEAVGFVYHSRITIWKDPVVEMQRTKALGLLHKQIKKDSTMSRVGLPDYVLVFRKDGERNNPVRHYGSYEEAKHACEKDHTLNINEEASKVLDVDLWQKIASPVWMDIEQGRTLQGWRDGRDDNDEKHICPLQLDTIERLIQLYTNKGDTVLTPFMGIGSEVYSAVKMGRKGIGFELKESYYDIAKKNMAQLEIEQTQLSFF